MTDKGEDADACDYGQGHAKIEDVAHHTEFATGPCVLCAQCGFFIFLVVHGAAFKW